MEKKYKFHVHGMHCNSCVLLIEESINALPNVTKAKANLHDHALEVSGDFSNLSENEIADLFTAQIKDSGYTVSLEKKKSDVKWDEFQIAVPIALGFSVLFALLQKTGLVNLTSGSGVNYGTAFVVGIIASLSTCMAVVGGLVLSMSATFAKNGEKVKPQAMFHLGRIISFFVLGGLIGALGASFTLNTTGTFILGILIGVIMLVLGINLLDIFPWAKKLQPSMPKFIARKAHRVSNMSHSVTPFLVGIATFFLPCGFTQSMQLYTLSTGGFLKGGLTMLAFALGTLPVLALISFSAFSIKNNKNSGVFFKSAGLVVILFALFNIINALVIAGILSPIFNF